MSWEVSGAEFDGVLRPAPRSAASGQQRVFAADNLVSIPSLVFDMLGEMALAFAGALPDRQPWRALVATLYAAAVAGAVVAMVAILS